MAQPSKHSGKGCLVRGTVLVGLPRHSVIGSPAGRPIRELFRNGLNLAPERNSDANVSCRPMGLPEVEWNGSGLPATVRDAYDRGRFLRYPTSPRAGPACLRRRSLKPHSRYTQADLRQRYPFRDQTRHTPKPLVGRSGRSAAVADRRPQARSPGGRPGRRAHHDLGKRSLTRH